MPSLPAAIQMTGWIDRWRPILPLMLAELVVWVGFGALLPILPLFFTAAGIDLATLGVVVAAWPAARLVGEPVFGRIADRTARKPLMVGALVANAVLIPLPLVFGGAFAFVLLRALAGLATAAYDPAARGYIVDATPSERHGEAFGLYGAAQMAGLLVGPAIGGFGASLAGDQAVVFLFGAVASAIAGLLLAVLVQERPRVGVAAGESTRGVAPGIPTQGVAEMETGVPSITMFSPGGREAPASLANRLLVAAVVINAGSYFAAGTYEVIWSIYLISLGAGLDLVGATFALFGLPILLLSPLAGRFVDRRGSLGFIVVGTVMAAIAGVLYTLITDPALSIPIILFEATGLAITSPALYQVVAAGSPVGRSSTAQGLFGAAGTVGFIVSSLVAGELATLDLRYPFWAFALVSVTALVIGLAIGWRAIRSLRRTAPVGASIGAQA